MPRHRRRKKRQIREGGNQDNRFVLPAGLQGLLYTPHTTGLFGIGGSTASALRERVLKITPQVQRQVAEQSPLIQSIINVRCDQVAPFTQRLRKKGQKRGFRIIPNDPTVKEDDPGIQDDIDSLTAFFEETGFNQDPDREDDFEDFTRMLVREIFTVDQIATEIQYNRRGNPTGFWLLDGTTIKRLDKRSPDYHKHWEGYSYLQEIEQKVKAAFTHDMLIFDYQNKRVDLTHRGYGYSPVEQCIDALTTLLFSYTYARDQFTKDKMPKGFISIMGDAGAVQVQAVREHFVAAMEGAGGEFVIPVVPSGKDGVGIDFKRLDQSNRDMEYSKLSHFFTSLVCAVFGIDPAEMGIKSDDSQSLFATSVDTRQGSSRDRGLAAILSFVERICNKVLRRVTEEYSLVFVGHDAEEEEKRVDLAKKRLEVDTSIDELRMEDGKDPYEETWSQMPLNPHAVQIQQSEAQAEQLAGDEDEEFDEDEGDDVEEYDEDEEGEVYDPDEVDAMQKSYMRFKQLSRVGG